MKINSSFSRILVIFLKSQIYIIVVMALYFLSFDSIVNKAEAQQKPDLKVINMTCNPKPAIISGRPATLYKGNAYYFEAKVKNNSPISINGVVYYNFIYRCISSDCTEDINNTQVQWGNFNSFSAGEVKTWSSKFAVVPKSHGLYEFSFTVDPDNMVHEFDDSNLSNQWKTTVYVK